MLFQACSPRFADNDHMCAALTTKMGEGAARRLHEDSELSGHQLQGEKGRRLKAIADDPTSYVDKTALDPSKLGKFGGGLYGIGSVIPEGQREL